MPQGLILIEWTEIIAYDLTTGQKWVHQEQLEAGRSAWGSVPGSSVEGHCGPH